MTDFERAVLVDLRRIASALESLVGAAGQRRSPIVSEPLLAALADVFGRDVFTSAEVWREAEALREGAEAAGLRLPDLPDQLQRAGIEGAHAVGRWLAGREGRGLARAGSDRAGVLWTLAVSRGDETANAPQPIEIATSGCGDETARNRRGASE